MSHMSTHGVGFGVVHGVARGRVVGLGVWSGLVWGLHYTVCVVFVSVRMYWGNA